MLKGYEKILRNIYSRKEKVKFFRALDASLVLLTALSFLFGACVAFYKDVWLGVGYLLTLALAYVLVTLVRHFINAPRPYELFDFFETLPKSTQGHSFPSRHVFSAFAIGVAELFVFVPLAIPTLVFGACLAVCRCLLGIHFPRDVIAGALVGCVTSLIGMLII